MELVLAFTAGICVMILIMRISPPKAREKGADDDLLARFSKIQVDMSKTEVLDIMGAPSKTQRRGSKVLGEEIKFIYKRNGFLICSIIFEKDRCVRYYQY